MMGRLIIATVILFSSSMGFAQVTVPSMSNATGGSTAMGSTAAPPPGASAAAAALDGAGVPLGATELFVGGLSPSPTDLGGGCSSGVGIGMLGTGAIFAGDGTLTTSSSDLGGATSGGDTSCSIAPTAGVGPLGLSSTTGDAAAFGGGNIPLAATAVPTTGLGGTIAAPGSISPCASTGMPAVATSPLQNPLLGSPSPLVGTTPLGASIGNVC
jgi:hypothetical protein